MKSIVVPTDFSASSINAVNYAADLALITECNLSVLHVCVIPVAIGEPLPIVSADELIADAEKQMADLKTDLDTRMKGKISVNTEVRQGGIMSEIYNYCHSVNPWLVVMGAEKAGAFERLFLGGRTTDALQNLQWPLIIVPAEATFHTIHRIGLACDLRDVEKTIPVKQIEELVNEFKAELYVLHVSTTPGEQFTNGNIDETDLLRKLLDHLDPKYKIINDTNVEEGLDQFAQRHHVDLLIVIPKKHSIFQRIFHKSQSKEIVLASHLPLLAIHE
jgi:nucleotide-binding universal stress UspA family protein